MIGTILGNRYRILELIGEGGMALVYKAEDTLLNREVAIKVLRPQYATDSEFVERFRREAQSAASLSHPNVVNIYDVGRQDGVDYIVMEYVRGETLKEIIRREAPLPIGRVLDISRQISEALYHAHLNNIVHRDIKPHNILVARDGRVKVTDFGIARAASGSSVTQTGVVLGSVQYFSPEQAKGVPADQSSDLYSLGCVMYELLTGTVPFKGDSPISVALKHIQEGPIPPRHIRPGIPLAVEAIVMKALEKSKQRRYQSAGEMIRDFLRAEGRPEAPVNPEIEATAVLPAVRPHRHIPWWLIAAAALALPVLGFLGYLLWPQGPGPSTRVPTLVGLTEDEARQKAAGAKLRMRVLGKAPHDQRPEGVIFYQDTPPQSSVRRNSVVGVKISLGREQVEVPDLRGLTELEGQIRLENVGLVLGEVVKEPNAELQEGLIFKQVPEAGERAPHGEKIKVFVSQGVQTTTVGVPYMIGKSLEQAKNELTALGLLLGRVVTQPTTVYKEGEIIEQNPLAGETVPLGTRIDFTVAGTQNSMNGGFNSFQVSVIIPPGPPDQVLRIVVQDQDGEREEYTGTHQPGETFTYTVRARGRARVIVYLNGKKIDQFQY